MIIRATNVANSELKALKFILIIVLIGAAAAGATAYWVWTELNSPVQHEMVGKPVNIPLGSTTDQTIQKLREAGIVSHALPLKLYIKLKGTGQLLKAGDYLFPSPIAPVAVVQRLEQGGEAAAKLTIIEGWTRWDIANAMAAIPTLKLKNADAALALMTDASGVRDLDPHAASIEGYMFPDTYFVQSTTTAKEVLDSAVKHFHQVWNEHLAQKARVKNQSAHDIVTVASIVETEAKLPQDRPNVASVIYNRLRKNMPLSVDSTIVYASKLAGKWRNDGKVYLSDINRDSPYNTRKYAGLTPAPVGNPGLKSLEAAVEPANTGYIYFVRDPARIDGAHNFYVDAAGFELGVQALRNWEKQQGTTKKNTSEPKSTAQIQTAESATTSALNVRKSAIEGASKNASRTGAETIESKLGATHTTAAKKETRATPAKKVTSAKKKVQPSHPSKPAKPTHSAAKAQSKPGKHNQKTSAHPANKSKPTKHSHKKH